MCSAYGCLAFTGIGEFTELMPDTRNGTASESSAIPGQQVHKVVINDYVYLVRFVEEDDYYFLKTVIPSRRATRE